MKIINLQKNLFPNSQYALLEMANLYSELKDKKAEEGDLIRENKKDLGVILYKDDKRIYLGSFTEENKILITEFNHGTFAQFFSVKRSDEYSQYKKIIENSYKEAVMQ